MNKSPEGIECFPKPNAFPRIKDECEENEYLKAFAKIPISQMFRMH